MLTPLPTNRELATRPHKLYLHLALLCINIIELMPFEWYSVLLVWVLENKDISDPSFSPSFSPPSSSSSSSSCTNWVIQNRAQTCRPCDSIWLGYYRSGCQMRVQSSLGGMQLTTVGQQQTLYCNCRPSNLPLRAPPQPPQANQSTGPQGPFSKTITLSK